MKGIVSSINKLKTANNLNCKVYFLLPEAFVIIGFSHVLLLFFPYKITCKYFGTLHQDSPYDVKVDDILLENIASAIAITSKYVFWKAECFTQAIAGKIMLNRRHLKSTLYLGVKREDGEEPEGHAWLRCGNKIVTGGNRSKSYQTIATYA